MKRNSVEQNKIFQRSRLQKAKYEDIRVPFLSKMRMEKQYAQWRAPEKLLSLVRLEECEEL